MIDLHPDLPASPLNFAASYNNFPDGIKTQFPDNYSYIWAKASLMVQLCFKDYAKNDYFHFPLKGWWIHDDFSQAMHQIVNDLRGFCDEFPITITNESTILHLLFTLHFWVNDTTKTNSIIKVEAIHLIEDDLITLYFTTETEL